MVTGATYARLLQPEAALNATAVSVAVLFSGGLRGFNEDSNLWNTTNRASHLAFVLASLRTEASAVHLFACNEPLDSPLTNESVATLENSGARVITLPPWDLATLVASDDDPRLDKPFLWALRTRKCYLESTSEPAIARGALSSYSFYLRLRPDIVFARGYALPLLNSWRTDVVSMRMRMYAGPHQYVAAHQQRQMKNSGMCGEFASRFTSCAVSPNTTSFKDDAECIVVDDQLFIVPALLAPAVFAYAAADSPEQFADPAWCAAPPIYWEVDKFECPLQAGGKSAWSPPPTPNFVFPEAFFTYHLARQNVSFDIIEVRAWLERSGAPKHEMFNWSTPLDCLAPHAPQ